MPTYRLAPYLMRSNVWFPEDWSGAQIVGRTVSLRGPPFYQ